MRWTVVYSIPCTISSQKAVTTTPFKLLTVTESNDNTTFALSRKIRKIYKIKTKCRFLSARYRGSNCNRDKNKRYLVITKLYTIRFIKKKKKNSDETAIQARSVKTKPIHRYFPWKMCYIETIYYQSFFFSFSSRNKTSKRWISIELHTYFCMLKKYRNTMQGDNLIPHWKNLSDSNDITK